MTRFIQGEPRTQTTLFPERLEDYISDDNSVRVIEAFVDELDLESLGFQGMIPKVTGRPAYHPSTMLKLYIYGYLNRIQSTRRLEREAGRNVELMWLLGRLTPDFKTIANFRRHNGKAIRKVCAQFVGLCRQLNLFNQALVAIDGSKFKAVNNRDKNFTPAKMKRRLEEIERSIGRYFSRLDRVDREEPTADSQSGKLQEKIDSLKEEMKRLKARTEMGVEDLEVVADRGYYKSQEIKVCDDEGITAYIPKSHTSNNRARGLFDKQDFRYLAETDEYRCPAGERLPKRTTTKDSGKIMYRYWSSNCRSCPLKPKCTPGRERRVSRWEHEAILDRMEQRLARDPEKMRTRRETVEHPYGTLKAWMGATHFQMTTLKHVSTEMSLHVLAYNLKRVMNIMGVESLIEAIKALLLMYLCLFRPTYELKSAY